MTNGVLIPTKLTLAGSLMALCGVACIAETNVLDSDVLETDALADRASATQASAEALINSNQGPHREGDCIASTNPNGCIDCWAQRDEDCHECTGNADHMYCCRVGNCEILNKPAKLIPIGVSGAVKDLGSTISTQP